MDGWIMGAMYVVPAAVLALFMNRSRFLRRRAGWNRFGDRARPDSVEGAQAAVLASIGTGRTAGQKGNWRVFKPSIGLRALPFALGAGIIYHYINPADLEGLQVAPDDTPAEMFAAMMLAVVCSCVYVLRTRVSTDGDVLRVRGVFSDRRFALDRLRDIEEDGVHSYRLSFFGGNRVEIFKTVEGAAELRHMLGQRLEQNLRG